MSTRTSLIKHASAAALLLAAVLPGTGASQTLFERNRGPSVSGKVDAPIDLTGTWVSVINEDWRWRMITPPKGDFQSIPLNADGKQAGMQWNPEAMYEADTCKAYGVWKQKNLYGKKFMGMITVRDLIYALRKADELEMQKLVEYLKTELDGRSTTVGD